MGKFTVGILLMLNFHTKMGDTAKITPKQQKMRFDYPEFV